MYNYCNAKLVLAFELLHIIPFVAGDDFILYCCL